MKVNTSSRRAEGCICVVGQSDKIKETLKDKFWPTLLAGYAVWPLAHVINFRFIPNSQRVLYINAVNVSTFTQSFAFASPENFHHALMSSSHSDKLLC